MPWMMLASGQIGPRGLNFIVKADLMLGRHYAADLGSIARIGDSLPSNK